MSRTVTLVLVDGSGALLGALPPVTVALPYWQEVADVVAAARERFGIEVTILRILDTERPVPHGGAVTYLGQADEVPAELVAAPDVDLAPHPLRAAYAEPGGPAASLRWAAKTRAFRSATQLRTWNLSSIWRLDTGDGPVWLKQVPHFLAHEAAVLRWAAQTVKVPTVLAAADGRVLLDHIPGADLYGAGVETRYAIAAEFHPLQVAAAGSVDTLLAAGVPDRRTGPLLDAITAVAAGRSAELDALVAGLPERFAAIEACGLPDTLVHGDLHPGNVRGDAEHRTIIDWGDSFIGHPGFDILRLSEGADDPQLVATWAERWRTDVPGSDPLRAVELLRPVAALRSATVYATFLANIEPAEHKYHAADVGDCLAAALSG